MREITKKYTNGEVTVIWKPHVCIHSTICFRGLPAVFDPRVRPWIEPAGGTTQEIINQVKKCPSGAISYTMNNETNKENTPADVKVQVLKKGPYLVNGTFTFVDDQGVESVKEGNIALCRCGLSNNKPFCDGSHRQSTVLD